MPPQILLVLPRLPEQLEYRFIGERLVLLDVHSITIVDYLDRAPVTVGSTSGSMRTHRPTSLPVLVLALVAGCAAVTVRPPGPATVVEAQSADAPVALPNREGSLKFLVIGDFGNGSREQLQLAELMEKHRQKFPFEVAITVGDNIYGSNSPQSFEQRFEVPYKPLLDAGVKFYASSATTTIASCSGSTSPFNMDGKFYYTLKAPQQDVRFFALESSYPTVQQIGWIERELQQSNEKWKIAYFHHPLYSSGERHGSRNDCRRSSSRFSSRTTSASSSRATTTSTSAPSRRMASCISSSARAASCGAATSTSGRRSPPRGTTRDRAFLLAEISGDELSFNAIARTGEVVDSGVIVRRQSRGSAARSFSFSLGACFAFASLGACFGFACSQSVSNTACIFFAIRESLMITPTSRRPSSSSLRRLWLPMNALFAVANDGADVQPQAQQLPRLDAGDRLLELAEDPDLDAAARAILQHALDQVVADLRVVDEQLLLGAADERGQQLARRFRADDQTIV